MDNKNKSFNRLAFERLISNLLSVKVWLFFVPLALSVGFLYWAMDLVTETTLIIHHSLSDQSAMADVAKNGLNNISYIFSSWLKFTGSMIATVIGVREVWKVAKIKEESRDKDRTAKERMIDKEKK